MRRTRLTESRAGGEPMNPRRSLLNEPGANQKARPSSEAEIDSALITNPAAIELSQRPIQLRYRNGWGDRALARASLTVQSDFIISSILCDPVWNERRKSRVLLTRRALDRDRRRAGMHTADICLGRSTGSN